MRFIHFHTIFYLYLLRICLVYGQCNNGLYFPDKNSLNTLSLPVQYVPTPTPTNHGSPVFNRQCDLFTNVPSSFDSSYQNYPGEAEVRKLQSSYPGQPVIIINNGGDFDRKEPEFDIEELLTLLLAFGGGCHGKRHHNKPDNEIPKEKPDIPRYLPSYSYYGYPGSGIDRDVPENMKPRKSPAPNKINITIILPNTSSSTSVQVENNTKAEKKNKGEITEKLM